MLRKPASWKEVEEEFQAVMSWYPRVTPLEIWGTEDVPAYPMETFRNAFPRYNNQWFVLVRPNGNEYLVRTEGAQYMRYIERVK